MSSYTHPLIALLLIYCIVWTNRYQLEKNFHPSLSSPTVGPSPSESACLPAAWSLFGLEIPETISSILKSIQADSTAVLQVYILTAHGSQILASSIFSILHVLPFIPHMRPGLGLSSVGSIECFALSSVSIRTTSPPQFWANVLGITSKALARALYGHQ